MEIYPNEFRVQGEVFVGRPRERKVARYEITSASYLFIEAKKKKTVHCRNFGLVVGVFDGYRPWTR